MMKSTNLKSTNRWMVAISVAALALGGVFGAAPGHGAEGEPKRGEERSASPGEAERDSRRDSWSALSAEERGTLRSALREVWTDPDVVSAREEVRQSSDAYQAAVREAVVRADPGAAKLLEKVTADDEGGGPMGRSGSSRRPGFDSAMHPPAVLERLTPEERERLQAAESLARESEKVQEARAALEALRQKDEDLRKERYMAYRNLRRAMAEAAREADPGIEELQKRIESDGVRGRRTRDSAGPERRKGGDRGEERGDPDGGAP